AAQSRLGGRVRVRVSFMGIGLVDPILRSLASKLHATPAQVELLFTSYLIVTAVAMLVTGWVSSRIGAKRTLVAGLALIVIFSALAGASGGIGRSWTSEQAGDWGILCSSPRSWRSSSDRRAADSPERSCSTRPRSGLASPWARWSGPCLAASAGEARSSALRP